MNNELNFLIYNTPEENISINAVVKEETIWLTQKAMSELFGVGVSAISKHLKNIFEEGELEEKVVISILETTTEHGAIVGKTQTKATNFYNLDAIISVGYRVNSRKATNFRIWATGILKEYMTKGFAMDDERLKQGKTAFGKDYFKELLERVRSIRASERRIWLQITDMFQECSIDYDNNTEVTHEFYAMVQNKFHYAITGKTAAEIIDISADKTKENMEKTLSFDPKTFTPGINYILLEMIERKTIKTDAGIIVESGDDDAFNKMDVATKSAKIVALGPVDKYGTKYPKSVIGKTVIVDAYVGIPMNAADVADSEKYKVILSNDILAFVDKETQE